VKAFAALYRRLDASNRTRDKVEALAGYFREASAADAAWVVSFFCGRRLGRLAASPRLREWAAEAGGIPDWLFDEAYALVGDLAETIALVLPEPETAADLPLHVWIEQRLLPLRSLPEDEVRARITAAWTELGRWERFAFNKLLTGGLRVGVSRNLVARALASAGGLEPAVVSHRLMGDWAPSASFFEGLLSADGTDADASRPYPFFLAYPLEAPPETLGAVGDFQAEWKWDGIRGQLVRREGVTALWTRGEELVTDRYPEIAQAAADLPPGTVLDGEILPWKNGRPMDFGSLQRRIGRKSVSRRLLSEVPVVLMAYDLIEHRGRDIRTEPLAERRRRLSSLLHGAGPVPITASPLVEAAGWEDLDRLRRGARRRGVEGLMLKRTASAYRDGRRKGDWWKWKVAPLTVDAVLIYAQPGHGRRAGLFTDYTFAVRDGEALVPFAKAYSGLDDREIREVDRFVRRHTLERFGPVRSVAPRLVFEIAFEAIRASSRHKSGIAVRFPRIHRWRRDKGPEAADTLESLERLLRASKADGPPEPGGGVGDGTP
jgi:DNA ligase-1